MEMVSSELGAETPPIKSVDLGSNFRGMYPSILELRIMGMPSGKEKRGWLKIWNVNFQ